MRHEMRSFAVLLTLALCVAASAPPIRVAAADATSTESPPKDGTAAETAAVSNDEDFIRETRVYFPQSVGKLYLESSSTHPVNGISLRYGYDGATFPADLFVFPVGRMSEAQAIEFGMAELLQSFEDAQRLGYYSKVDLDRPRDTEVPLNPLLRLQGKQVDYSAHKDGKDVFSHSLLVYRSYYLIKLRVTAPKKEKRAARDIAQEVTRTLIPALRFEHVGGCRKNKEITIIPTDRLPPARDRVAADGNEVIVPRGRDYGDLLIEAAARKADTVCVENFDGSKVEAGEKFEVLQIPSGAWKTNQNGNETPSK